MIGKKVYKRQDGFMLNQVHRPVFRVMVHHVGLCCGSQTGYCSSAATSACGGKGEVHDAAHVVGLEC